MEFSPLVALAPDASLPEEQPSPATDVTASPVFHYLDELLSSGKISRVQAAHLKCCYRRLRDTLKSSQDSQLHLLGEAKRCRAEVERLRAEVESTEERGTSVEPESEVNELRQQLLQAYNELKAAEDREYETQHQLKWLWEEKQYLERENEIQPKPAELESRTKALQDRNEDLRREVYQRHLEVRSLTEDVEAQEAQILKDQKELEDKMKIIELKEAEKAQLISIPDHVLKEIERKRCKREAAVKKTEELKSQILEMEQEASKVAESNRSLRLKNEELNEELERLGAEIDASQKQCRQLLKKQEVSREDEAQLIGNRSILEIKLQNTMCDRKHLYERQCVQLKEKNRQMQALKRTEQALTVATEQLQQTQSIHRGLQAQVDGVPKREAFIQQRMELHKEVDALKVSFEKQLSVAEDESHKMQHYGTIQELLKESNCLQEELHNLRCLTQIKLEERGKKHREQLRAEQLNQHIQQELQEKDVIITEHNKLNAVLQRRISKYCKLCSAMMEEKDKYITLKQIASQTITELTEQLKALEDETQVQRAVVSNKDQLLTKAHIKISHNTKIRDNLRNDISKVTWQHHLISQEYEDNKLELMKLTQTTNLQEQALLQINKNQETATQRRNFLGIQLLEHEEILFNCYEKVNIQEAAITKGNMTLETLEKEMRHLRLEINELRRQIDLKKKEVPFKKRLEEEITVLQIELSEARDKTLEGISRSADYRELKGDDLPSGKLVEKIEQLETYLADTERRTLEKHLLVDKVTRLTKPLSEQTDKRQQEALSLAKKLNEIRAQIFSTNHRLMAASAELSMKQAVALSLQHEVKEKELQVDRCQRQLEQGLPPCPEMENEWRRMLRDKRRRQRDKERLAEEQEWNLLPNGKYTTAEARPNAYIPQTDSLPLPRPYGAQAPFKPSQPGANMRHIRKPPLRQDL